VIFSTHRLEAEDTAFDGDRYLGDYVEAEVLLQTVIRETIIDVTIIRHIVHTGLTVLYSHLMQVLCACAHMTV
jgi:hypothetical protein